MPEPTGFIELLVSLKPEHPVLRTVGQNLQELLGLTYYDGEVQHDGDVDDESDLVPCVGFRGDIELTRDQLLEQVTQSIADTLHEVGYPAKNCSVRCNYATLVWQPVVIVVA